MKTNVIEIVPNTQIIKRAEKFNLRWNILCEEDREKLRSRCMAIITNEFNKIKNNKYSFSYFADYLNNFCLKISMIIGIPSKTNNFQSFEAKYLYDYILRLDLKKYNNYITFIKFIEETLNYDYSNYINNDDLAKRFAEAFKLSNIKMKIIKDDDEYCIFPTNIEFLDSPLIFDNLLANSANDIISISLSSKSHIELFLNSPVISTKSPTL